MRKFLWLFVVIFLFTGYDWYTNREVPRPAGVLAPADPIQSAVGTAGEMRKKDVRIKPLAAFDITARVILKKRYWFGRATDLSPVDLVLGWGPMSDGAILKHFEFDQTDRFYYWSTRHLVVPRDVVQSHTANMHMIPANPGIEKELTSLRRGNIVRIKGYLVEASSPDGWRWRSSLTREDTGNGACEVIWVESIQVE